jgi:hypothetical protein
LNSPLDYAGTCRFTQKAKLWNFYQPTIRALASAKLIELLFRATIQTFDDFESQEQYHNPLLFPSKRKITSDFSLKNSYSFEVYYISVLH